MALCNCPGTGYVPTIDEENCPFNMGQIQMLLFTTDLNYIAGDPTLLGTWTQLKAASDATKVSGFHIGNPEFAPGDENIFGENSNETPNGEGIKVGEWGASLTCRIYSQSPAMLEQVKALECVKPLHVFLVNGENQVYGRGMTGGVISGSTGKIMGIPVGRFSLRDLTSSLTDPTMAELTIKFQSQWWKKLAWATVPGMLENF